MLKISYWHEGNLQAMLCTREMQSWSCLQASALCGNLSDTKMLSDSSRVTSMPSSDIHTPTPNSMLECSECSTKATQTCTAISVSACAVFDPSSGAVETARSIQPASAPVHSVTSVPPVKGDARCSGSHQQPTHSNHKGTADPALHTCSNPISITAMSQSAEPINIASLASDFGHNTVSLNQPGWAVESGMAAPHGCERAPSPKQLARAAKSSDALEGADTASGSHSCGQAPLPSYASVAKQQMRAVRADQ